MPPQTRRDNRFQLDGATTIGGARDRMPMDTVGGGGFETMPPPSFGGVSAGAMPPVAINPLDGLSGGGAVSAMPPVGGGFATMPPTVGGSAGGGNPLDALAGGAAPQPWQNGGPSGNPLEGLTPGMGRVVETPGRRAMPAQSRGMAQVTKKRPGGRMY